MTKQEYLNTVLMTEDRGWLDRSDISEIASKAWDAAVEATAEAATNWINKYLVEWSIIDSDDLQDFNETLKREMK